MAQQVRIPRSTSTNTPSSLDQGELAYSEDGSPNGEGELFIGTAGATVTKITTTVTTGTDGVAAQPNSSAQDNQTITTGTGVSGADGGSTGDVTVSLDYTGADNFVDVATNQEGSAIATSDTIIYNDATSGNVVKGLVSDLPFGLGSGDISRVDITAGIGLTGDLNTVSGDHIQTIDMDFTTLTDMTGDVSGTTEVILNNAGTESRKAVSEIKLSEFNNNSGWEANDAATVLTTDAGSSSWNWILDEDAMGSDSATHVPTQQSVKAYVDNAVTGGLTHKGGYNASTNTPALDTGTPSISIGDMYTVTAAGTFFTEAVEIGDVLISDVDSSDAASLSDWTVVQSNIGAASESTAGYIQIATQGETNTGTNDTKTVTPLKMTTVLDDLVIDCGTF